MKIDYIEGDATNPIGQGNKIIVHICNDKGGWGKGFVLALSRKWSAPEQQYRAWHKGQGSSLFALGHVQFVQVAPDLWVANVIGQHGVRWQGSMAPIRYQAIRQGLANVAKQAKQLDAAVHMPRIGCGLAGGKWEEISRIIEEELIETGIPVTVYDLNGAS
jgi:O-acetyl-ADP-ribose deacetylase (regulator of RNase III)